MATAHSKNLVQRTGTAAASQTTIVGRAGDRGAVGIASNSAAWIFVTVASLAMISSPGYPAAYFSLLLGDDIAGLAHVSSPAARCRPDRNSSRCKECGGVEWRLRLGHLALSCALPLLPSPRRSLGLCLPARGGAPASHTYRAPAPSDCIAPPPRFKLCAPFRTGWAIPGRVTGAVGRSSRFGPSLVEIVNATPHRRQRGIRKGGPYTKSRPRSSVGSVEPFRVHDLRRRSGPGSRTSRHVASGCWRTSTMASDATARPKQTDLVPGKRQFRSRHAAIVP